MDSQKLHFDMQTQEAQTRPLVTPPVSFISHPDMAGLGHLLILS